MRKFLSKPILLALAVTIAGAGFIADDLGWSAPGWYGMAGAQAPLIHAVYRVGALLMHMFVTAARMLVENAIFPKRSPLIRHA